MKVAVLGCGSVGSQVVRLLLEQADDLEARIGASVEIAGIAVRRIDAPREVDVPDDLRAALADHPEAVAHFDGLAASHRKEWVRWIEEAKRPETREARVAKTVAGLREGRKTR